MKIMTFTVSVPDDVITSERINHSVICEEVKSAIVDSMILEDTQVQEMTVILREIE